MKTLFHSRQHSSKGAALMIVLALVVLLTGIALAYFSRTTTDRQLAQLTSNDTTADLLARSALDIVVNDFKQEIASNQIPSATATPTGTPVCYSIVGAQIVNTGNYYVVGDTLDPVSGTLCASAPSENYGFRLYVNSVDSVGHVTAVSIIPGIGYSVRPSNPIGFGGSATGSGFTANCTFTPSP
jgi:hypothetical protein